MHDDGVAARAEHPPDDRTAHVTQPNEPHLHPLAVLVARALALALALAFRTNSGSTVLVEPAAEKGGEGLMLLVQCSVPRPFKLMQPRPSDVLHEIL